MYVWSNVRRMSECICMVKCKTYECGVYVWSNVRRMSESVCMVKCKTYE